MRFLALATALLTGSSAALGIGEFEKRIEAAHSLDGKIALAEEAFDSITGFVPRELFMSYWSIDALEPIATAYKDTLESEGIRALIPEYSNISRICGMEMGDYRYFFEPLKAELDTLFLTTYAGKASPDVDSSHGKASPELPFSNWTAESILALIDYWTLTGESGISNEIEDLRHISWFETDIVFWELLFSKYELSPSQLIDAFRLKLLIGDCDPYLLAQAVAGQFLNYSLREQELIIAKSESEVSAGGPRLDSE